MLVDLGSGDGVVLKAASDCGAKALGVELNPLLVLLTKIRFMRNQQVHVKCGNLFKINFPKDTTVVYLFGDGRDIKNMARAIQKQADLLQRNLYVISNAFQISDFKQVKKYRAYYLYEVNYVKTK